MRRVAPRRGPGGAHARARQSLSTVLRGPFTPGARHELTFCLLGALTGMAGIAVVVALVAPGTAVSASRGSTIFGLLVLLLVATGGARRVGAAHRRLAALPLAERVGAPAPSADEG